MDQDNIADFIIAGITLLLGGGGLGALIQGRVQAKKTNSDIWIAQMQEQRASFESMSRSLKDEMQRLKDERDQADKKAEAIAREFAEYKGRSETRIDSLEEKVGLLEAIVERAQLVCPYARENPGRCALAVNANSRHDPRKVEG